jgi:hypothetical protein
VANQDIAADVTEVGERLSRTYRRAPQVTLKASGSIDRLAPHQQVTAQRPACWGVDPEVFFGPADGPAGRPLHLWERRALAVCAGCPVVMACLAAALEFPATEQYGVVGGMTAGQRRAVLQAPRRRRGRAQRPRKGGQGPAPRRGTSGPAARAALSRPVAGVSTVESSRSPSNR